MQKIYTFLFVLVATVLMQAQSASSFTSTPDSAIQSPRPGSTGTFQINYSGSVFNNANVFYSICCNSSKSTALDLYRFNFNIPPTATITGVTASYSTTGGNGGPTNYKWDSLVLINNLARIGNYKRDSINGTGGTFNHGGPADTWGNSLTPAIVNSPHFGLRIHLDTYGINTTMLGAFKLVIHYSVPTSLKENTTVGKPKVYCGNHELFVKRETSDHAHLTIFALTGKKMAGFTVEGTNESFDISQLAPGCYLYNYRTETQNYSGKFMVE